LIAAALDDDFDELAVAGFPVALDCPLLGWPPLDAPTAPPEAGVVGGVATELFGWTMVDRPRFPCCGVAAAPVCPAPLPVLLLPVPLTPVLLVVPEFEAEAPPVPADPAPPAPAPPPPPPD
jgi:hypothetical protein